MATLVGTGHRTYVSYLDLSGVTNEVDFGAITIAMEPCTTYNDGGYSCVKPGLISGQAMLKGYIDFAAGVQDSDLSIPQLKSQYPLTIIPSTTGSPTAGDRAYLSRGIFSKYQPLDGPIGKMGGFTVTVDYDTALIQGWAGHPLAARTANGTGTAVAQAGPTAAQKLWSAIHVTAYSGFTNVVVKVQSDDAVGFPSATDRITHTTITGLTSEFSSVAGSFSTETHLRYSWTVTGSGSISFVGCFGVL